MSQFTVDQALQIAIQYQQNGQLLEAEDIYRQILAVFPDQADALHLLGVAEHQANRNDVAEEMIRKALNVAPGTTNYRLSLGSVLQAQQRTDEAIECYQQALAIDPTSADACSNMGVALTTACRFAEAVDAFERALQLSPGHTGANGNMGIALCYLGRYEEALRALRTAIAYQPRVAAFHASLGAALFHLGQPEAALEACEQALSVDPSHGRAHQILSMVYTQWNRAAEAIEESRLAAQAMPDLVDAQIIYGAGLHSAGRFDESVAFHRKAILQFPQCASLHNNFANTLKDQGLLDEALAEYRQAITFDPAAQFHSNYLYTLHYHPKWSPRDIFEEHRRFNQMHALPLQNEFLPFANNRTADRRLRIGYISTEFRGHSLGLYLFPIISNHDKTQFEIFCYADVPRPDFYTYRFQQCADHWRSIAGSSDAQIAELVRRDRIDILVDLHLHMAGNRLLTFARKPAPVSVSFAGYPGTTGLTAIDFRLTDRHLEPLDSLPAPSSEIPIRLPDTFWCYLPYTTEVAVNTLPAKDLGYITFGNLNNFCKINEPTLELWSLIMKGVTRSRLLMLTAEGAHRKRTRDFLARRGIAEDRIDFVTRMPAEKYYRVYHRIDLGLDSFPYNGHTTSLDSFFMGVPVVTITGDTPVSRAGWCQLVNLGHPELAGKSPSEFVRIATELANDWNRLAALREKLRPVMQASPLMDQKRFAKNIEDAYRTMWQRWCENTPPAP